MKKLSKIITLILMVTMVVSLFTACGETQTTKEDENVGNVKEAEKPKEPEKKDEKVKIRIVTYHVGKDSWTGVYNECLDEYRKQHENVEIIDESAPAPGDVIRTKIKTDFASGNEPDISFFFTAKSDSEPLVKSGKLFAFDDELKNDANWGSNFSPAALDAVRYDDGKVYGLPTLGFFETMYCNKDLFDKYEVKIPTNFDELKQAVTVFRENDIIPIADSIADSYYIIETAILSAAGKNEQEALFTNGIQDSWLHGLNCIKQLYEMKAFPDDALTISESEANTLFADKKAAMLINGSWAMGQIKDHDNTIVVPVPSVADAKGDPYDIIGGFGSGWYMVEDLNEKKNNEPLNLVKYFTSQEIVEKFVAVGGIPGLKGIQPATATKLQNNGYEFMSQAKSTTVPINDKLKAEAFSHIRTNLAYIVEGQKTAEEILKEAAELNK